LNYNGFFEFIFALINRSSTKSNVAQTLKKCLHFYRW